MEQNILNLSDFSYDLPPKSIAQQPTDLREQSRLFVRHVDGSERHCNFSNIADEIPENSIIIVNDTKVFASRLLGKLKTGGQIEVFALGLPSEAEQSDQHHAGAAKKSEPKFAKAHITALAKPLRKLKIGTEVDFDGGVTGTVTSKNSTQVGMSFSKSPEDLLQWMNQFGYIPLPPYIHRDNVATANLSPDRDTYQTVYAREDGSVAAPTAGLHFNQQVMESLEKKGIKICPVTLHVGAGTFLPVTQEDVGLHVMHKEVYTVPVRTCKEICAAKREKRTIIGVGTTSFRSLESALRAGSSQPYRTPTTQKEEEQLFLGLETVANHWLETDLFIRPRHKNDRYTSSIFDGIITNFHQPGSTLFMLICSLIGFDNAIEHYNQALGKGYRFLSYGDSNLFWLR